MYSHGFLKVAAISPKLRTGDPMFNVKEMIKAIDEVKAKNPSIICFPELSICGSSNGDLFNQKYLYDDCLEAIRHLILNNTFKGIIIFGSIMHLNNKIFNCSIVLQKKKILGIVPKRLISNNELKWFSSGIEIEKNTFININGENIPFGNLMFDNNGLTFSVEINHDMYINNHDLLFNCGTIIVFNLSSIPAIVGQNEEITKLAQAISKKAIGTYIICSNNASDSTSDYVYSGQKVICENGKIISIDNEIDFKTRIIYGDIDISKLQFLRRKSEVYRNNIVSDLTKVSFDIEESDDFIFEKSIDKKPFSKYQNNDYLKIIDIQAASIIRRLDYININKVVLGVSGGVDSTLALLTLCYAFDKYNIPRQNIICYTLPSKSTSERTYSNATKLMESLKVTINEVNIYDDVLRQLRVIGHDTLNKDITYENVQARFRTYTLMNAANLNHAIVVGTSDMSEVALGWSTFNGDQMAMYGINAGLPKTALKEVVDYFSNIYVELKDVISSVLDTPISPELADSSQETEQIIGKYEINDFILYHFLNNGDDSNRICFLLNKAFNLSNKECKEYVNRFNERFYSQQYKRLTSPEAVQILDIGLSPRGELKINGDIYRTQKN